MNITTIKAKFFNSLKRGTGEAILISKHNPAIDFSYYIIKVASRDYSYDGQSEGNRAKYIFDLINLSSEKDKIRKAVITRLLSIRKDFWGLVQLFELAKMFAEQGDNEARQAIYKRFLNHVMFGGDWAGYRQILDLDGLSGLYFISEKYGKLISKQPHYIGDSSIIDEFQEENSDINVIKEMQKAAKKNKYIRLYLDTIKRTEKLQKNIKKVRPIYDDIITELKKSQRLLTPKRARELNAGELNKIGVTLMQETDPQNIEKYLRIFRFRKFPREKEFILRLAKSNSTAKNRIREYAIDALVFLKSDNIRQFALERIMKTKNPDIIARILVSNFRIGDSKILTKILQKTKKAENLHSLADSYIEIFKSNPSKECKQPLEILYDNLTCGVCRYCIIKLLIKNNVLSRRIKNEIRFDSYKETRELYKTLPRIKNIT